MSTDCREELDLTLTILDVMVEVQVCDSIGALLKAQRSSNNVELLVPCQVKMNKTHLNRS